MAKKSPITKNESAAAKNAESPPIAECTFQSFIENLPVMFYAVEPISPHTPIYISPTFEKFGYPLEMWMTDSDIWDRVIHPDDRGEVLTNTRALVAQRLRGGGELFFRGFAFFTGPGRRKIGRAHV